MKARKINGAVAVAIAAGLVCNALCEYSGWTLAGTIFGNVLLVATLWVVVDNKLKEREQA